MKKGIAVAVLAAMAMAAPMRSMAQDADTGWSLEGFRDGTVIVAVVATAVAVIAKATVEIVDAMLESR